MTVTKQEAVRMVNLKTIGTRLEYNVVDTYKVEPDGWLTLMCLISSYYYDPFEEIIQHVKDR